MDTGLRESIRFRMTAQGRIAPISAIASQWPESGRHATAALRSSYLGLFGQFQCIIHFNAQISDRFPSRLIVAPFRRPFSRINGVDSLLASARPPCLFE